MYKLKKVISLILILTLVLALPVSSFANKPDWANGNNGNSKWKNESSQTEVDEELEEEIDDLKDLIKDLEELILEVEDTILELKKEDKDYDDDSTYLDTLYEKLANLEKKLSASEDKLGESEDTEYVKSFNSNKYNNLLRKIARKGYTDSDLSKIAGIRQQLEKKYPGIAVLEVDSIFSEDVKFKFDTPPVIKEGRTLIPVAAIARGFKAYVEWIPGGDGTHDGAPKVMITKNEVVIEIWIGHNEAMINGEPALIDVNASIMNNRTIVPLRFIAEALRLNVEWNPGDRSIKISDLNLKVDAIGFRIGGKNIYVPKGTTAGALELVLTAPKDGTFDINADPENVLDEEDTVTVTNKFGNEATYMINFSLNLFSNDDDFVVDLDDDKVMMPNGTTLGALSLILSTPSGEITLLDDELDDDHIITEDDVILVTAEDGFKREYTIELP